MNTHLSTAILIASTLLTACTTKVESFKKDSKDRIIFTKYVEKKHCHTLKGMGWSKRVCHGHPVAHVHKGHVSNPYGQHKHNGKYHSHAGNIQQHNHK